MPKKRIIPLFIPHAGCPNLCVFCDQKKISGASTPVTTREVRRQIEEALAYAGAAPELAFYGGSFTAMDKEVQEGLLGAAEPYLLAGKIGSIRLSTRPDAVDEEICQMLRRYGVTTVELGCQSTDDEVLRRTKRGHTRADTLRAVALLKQHGFSVILQMMTGLPGDDGSASLKTAEDIIALKPDGVRIYPTVVLRGTELFREMLSGTYRPQSVEEAVGLSATLYEMFLQANIPVIRVGLNPTEDLSSGEAAAGAYHPALGELVLSELYLRRARRLLAQSPLEQAALSVHPSRVSVMVGQHRRNLKTLRREFPEKQLKVRGDAAGIWEISLKVL